MNGGLQRLERDALCESDLEINLRGRKGTNSAGRHELR